MSNEKNLTLKEAFDLAVHNHQNNHLQDAQNYYQKVIKMDPNHLGALNNLGVTYKNLGQIQKARDCYEKAIAIVSNHVDAHYNLGNLFQELGEHQKAKDCYEKVIVTDSNHVGAHYNLGKLFQKLREHQKAKDCYEKVIVIDSNHVDAHNNLGIIFKELGEHQKAKDCCEKAIVINPNYVGAHNNLGIIFKELGELQKAISCYEKAIKINPNYADAHNNLGVIYQDFGDFQKAKNFYEKVIKLEPDHLSAHKNLGSSLKQERLLSKIEQAKKSEIKTTISFLKKNYKKSHKSDLKLTPDPFFSNRKVEAELISQLYKINTKKLNDVNPNIDPRYGIGRNSDYKLFENNFAIIKTVEKDLINIMKEAVKSDIFIMESFFNIFQTGSGIIPHNHLHSFDNDYGLLNRKFSLSYYLDTGDQNCSEPGILKLQNPDREILPTEGMIVIFPASRKHSATYGGKKDRIMIGVNFYSLI